MENKDGNVQFKNEDDERNERHNIEQGA